MLALTHQNEQNSDVCSLLHFAYSFFPSFRDIFSYTYGVLMAASMSEWENTLEDLQAVLHTFNSPNTDYTDLSSTNSDVIQVSISHPTHLDITLEATISQTNSSPTLSVKSNNPIISSELYTINKELNTQVFSSLMEACMETFELINQRIDLTQNTNELELSSEIDSQLHYVVMNCMMRRDI